jgi:hypothetical protein
VSPKNVSFIYRSKLPIYALFINGENEAAFYRLICYIEVLFKTCMTVLYIYYILSYMCCQKILFDNLHALQNVQTNKIETIFDCHLTV